MVLTSLIWFGIDAALDRGLGAVGDLAKRRAQTILQKVSDHFTLSSNDLALAFQSGFASGVSAIALGVAPAGWLDAVLARRGQALPSKLAKDYAGGIEARAVRPFMTERGLAKDDQQRLRGEILRTCRTLAKQAGTILPTAGFPDGPTAASLLRDSRHDDLARLIVTQIGQSGLVLPALVIDFLCHDGLIGDATLYFIRETLRRNQRVQVTLNVLRQEAVWSEVEQARAGIDRLAKDFAQFQKLTSGAPQALEPALEALEGHVIDAVLAVGVQVAAVQAQNQEIHAVVREIQAMLAASGRGVEVKVADAVNPLSGGNAGLVDQARRLLAADRGAAARLPGAANTVAAALVSTGDEARIREAEQLLEQAFAGADDPTEWARAAHNLFQVRLLRRDFEAALGPLQAALTLDLRRYSPCEVIGQEMKYPIQRILGAGGMGCVFLCREPVRHNRLVAIKTLWQSKPGPAHRVFAEFQALETLGGAIVPKAFDYGTSPGTGEPYLVMEYLDGFLDGEAWLARHGALTPASAALVGLQVAQALAAAHGRTVNGKPAPLPHLDLKPANLMLAPGEGGPAVKLIDWGLARHAVALVSAGTAGTRAGTTQFGSMVMGTWDYAPPEQMGTGQPGPKSDVFALGKTLYRLATGGNPHTVSPRKLRALGDLGAVIEECLETDAKERPAAQDVAQRLAHLVANSSGKGKAEVASPTAPPNSSSAATGGSEELAVNVVAFQDGPASPRSSRRRMLVTGAAFLAAGIILAEKANMISPPVKPEVQPPPRIPTPTRTSSVQILEGTWLQAKCRFRDWGAGGKEDLTLPEMMVIPAGKFVMGSPYNEPERSGDEGPQRNVTIARPFALGRFAVTQAEYQAVIGSNPSHLGDRNPVETVSWEDAQAFIKALNQKLGLSTADGYRLPSEAEWEYACRAGTTTPFWWGSSISPEQANYDGNFVYNGGPKGQHRKKLFPLTRFRQTHSGYTRRMAMFGNGVRIVGTAPIPVRHLTAVHGLPEIVLSVFSAAAAGAAARAGCVRPAATGTRPPSGAASSGSALPGL